MSLSDVKGYQGKCEGWKKRKAPREAGLVAMALCMYATRLQTTNFPPATARPTDPKPKRTKGGTRVPTVFRETPAMLYAVRNKREY